MTPFRPISAPITHLVSRARTWPVQSQQVARRNAMLACTVLAARRAEREDVDEFFRGRTRRVGSAAPPRAARG